MSWAQPASERALPPPDPGPRRREGLRAALLAFLLTFLVVGGVVATFRHLYDPDSYFHLAVAREYARNGLGPGLPWARLSAMADGFGDKELLFHLLLVPFASTDSSLGPKLALAFVNALAAAAIAAFAHQAVGRWAVVLPVALLLTSVDLGMRALRLRPETLSLVLLLAAVWLAAHRKHLWLGLVALAYPLTHTSFHLLLPLCVAWLVHDRVRFGTWAWGLLAYPALGTTLGIVLHPHFPANVRVFFLQNVERYRHVLVDEGTEFQAPTLVAALMLNAAWAVALLLLYLSRRRRERPGAEWDPRPSGYLAIAAAFSGALFLFLPRFALYLVPFATLAFLFGLRRRQLEPSGTIAVGGRRVPLALALLLTVAPLAARNVLVMRYSLAANGVFARGRDDDYRRMSSKLPEGAKVAAPWAETEDYVFHAPQARYLNVQDPVFMAAWRPEAYRRQLAVFDGSEPDVPLAVATVLDSDFLAMSRMAPHGVGPRLAADPRLERRHEGYELLYAVRADANLGFVLDWRVSPTGAPPVHAGEIEAWLPYPRDPTARGRAVEGFVDGRRVAAPGCLVLSRLESASAVVERHYEFSPYGPSALWVDGRLVAQEMGQPGAVLGRGVLLPVTLSAGTHTMTVRTCPAAGYRGFYLLSRPPSA